MKISVIVCVSRQTAKATIESIKEQSYPCELVIIDDGLNPALEIEEPNVIYVRNATPRGLSFCRNLGISKRPCAEIFAFIDDDAIADENWIKEFIKSFAEGADIVGGFIEPKWSISHPFWLTERFYHLLAVHSRDWHPIFGCNFAVKKGLLDEINFKFREDLGRKIDNLIAGDELDLLVKAAKLKKKTIFNPLAKVSHLIPAQRLTLLYFLKRSFWEGRTFSRYGATLGLYKTYVKLQLSSLKHFIGEFKFLYFKYWVTLVIEASFFLSAILGSLWEKIAGAGDYAYLFRQSAVAD